MDLKTVQDQLKNDILKHQDVMAKLRKNPKNQLLQSSLREIQQHIAELGHKQKQLKSAVKDTTNHIKTDKMPVKQTFIDEKRKPSGTPGFIKLAPKPTNQPMHLVISEGNKQQQGLAITSSAQIDAQTSQIKSTVHTSQNVLTDKSDHHPATLKNTNNDCIVKREVNPKSNSPQKQYGAINLTKRLGKEVALISSATVASGNQSSPGNLLVQAPVQIKVSGPVAVTNPSYVLLSTKTINPGNNPTVLRLLHKGKSTNGSISIKSPPGKLLSIQPKSLTQSASGSAHVWFNVAGSGQGNTAKRFIPAAIRASTGDGVFQKYRILDGRIGSAVKPVAPLSKHSSDEVKHVTENKISPVPSAPALSPRNSHGSNSGASSPILSDAENKKARFLSVIGLVSKEKAGRIRSRRYGKRRSTVNPVYSGGIYVSTTGADTTKRMLPPDLLGFEELPVKRPRGRPRGSGKNTSSSLVPTPQPAPQSGNGGRCPISEEVTKIIELARPKPASIPPITAPSTSKGGTVNAKGSAKRSDSHEDHCAVCNEAGQVLMCDTCSLVYHMECLDPPLVVVPTGMWYCGSCKEKFTDSSTAPRWPGLISVVHAYIAFNNRRNAAVDRARKKSDQHKEKHKLLQQQIKAIASVLLTKVNNKNRARDYGRALTSSVNHLTETARTVKSLLRKGKSDWAV